MKFMINICYGHKNGSHPEDDAFVMEKYEQWSAKMRSITTTSHKLKDGEGRRLTLDKSEVVDGPYVETKEAIGGFYIIEAESYDQAVAYAKECPTLLYQGGHVEVREIEF